jgi:hypothetical protein
MPAKVPTEGTSVDIDKLIPQTHRDFVDKTLADLGVPPLPEGEAMRPPGTPERSARWFCGRRS